MKRVTGSRVVKAFKATGFRPTQQEFFCEYEGGTEACDLTALAVHEKNAPKTELDDGDHDKIGTTAIDRLELDLSYSAGFMSGWDKGGMHPGYLDKTLYDMGYEDGVKARRAVVKAGLAEFEV